MTAQTGPSAGTTKRTRFSPESVDALLDSLNRLKINQPKAVSQTIHIYESPNDSHDETDISSEKDKRYITSWKMQEHLYRRKDCPFPTLARGLFTATADASFQDTQRRGTTIGEEEKQKIRIVARGYDKFFNIGEVPWTEVGEDARFSEMKSPLTRIAQWDNLAKYSQGPYDLTYKSNGCLILISAISETEVLVTSKHSLGTTIVPKDKLEKDGDTNCTDQDGATQQILPAKEEPKASAKAAAPSPDVAPTFDLSTKSGQKKAAKYAAQQAKKIEKANADRDREAYQQEAKAEADAKKHQNAGGGTDSGVPAHAEMGRRWLSKTLKKVGKTERDLAKALWKRNVTAVTEVSALHIQPGLCLSTISAV